MMPFLKRWLRGKGMPQFSNRNYFGYDVDVFPSKNDRYRSKLYKLHLNKLPYFMGADIIFTLTIKPTIGAKPCSTLKYEWDLFKKDVDTPQLSGSGINETPNEKYTSVIDLKHLAFTDEYRLDLKIIIGDESLCWNVVDFEITSRASFELKFIWLSIGALFALLGIFVGAVITGVITYFIGW